MDLGEAVSLCGRGLVHLVGVVVIAEVLEGDPRLPKGLSDPLGVLPEEVLAVPAVDPREPREVLRGVVGEGCQEADPEGGPDGHRAGLREDLAAEAAERLGGVHLGAVAEEVADETLLDVLEDGHGISFRQVREGPAGVSDGAFREGGFWG